MRRRYIQGLVIFLSVEVLVGMSSSAANCAELEACCNGYSTQVEREKAMVEGCYRGAFACCGRPFVSSAKCTTGMESILSPGDALREFEPLSCNTHLVEQCRRTDHEHRPLAFWH